MTSKENQIIIAKRFRGPPQSGNGGLVSGVFANLINPEHNAGVEVTLRSPTPLGQPMRANVNPPGSAVVYQDSTVIAAIKPAHLALSIMKPPSRSVIKRAAPTSYSLLKNLNPRFPSGTGFHPGCFCCGADRTTGLGVFAAPVDDQVAALWPTKSAWADNGGFLPREFLWTAMDCPGQFAFLATGIKTGMLGRMTAQLYTLPKAGDELIITAWPIKIEGKKHFAGSAIFSSNQELIARAITVWVGLMNLTPTS
jgi:hypothetical protein